MNKSARCLYQHHFADFLSDDEQSVLGILCEGYHGTVQSTQIEA